MGTKKVFITKLYSEIMSKPDMLSYFLLSHYLVYVKKSLHVRQKLSSFEINPKFGSDEREELMV